MATDNNIRKRKRGIKASRQKLEKALKNAGFKTQTELAIRIADLEKLNNIPRDFVSKVFRELPVEHSSLERISSALGVESYTLFLNTQEEVTTPSSDTQSINKNSTPPSHAEEETKLDPKNLKDSVINTSRERTSNKRQLKKVHLNYKVYLITSVTIAFLIFFTINQASPTKSSRKLTQLPATLGKYGIIVAFNNSKQDIIPLASLKRGLNNDANLTKLEYDLLNNSLKSTNDILSIYQADLLLNINIEIQQNFVKVSASLSNPYISQNIWSIITRRSYFDSNLDTITQNLVDSILYTLDLKNQFTPLMPLIQDSEAANTYILGRVLLDQSQDVSKLELSEKYFRELVSREPDWALGNAALCESLIGLSWVKDEKIKLEEAEAFCDRAYSNAPEHPYVLSTLLKMLKRSGRIQEAITIILNMKTHPIYNDVDLLFSIASVYFEAFRQTPEDKDLLNKARTTVQLAISNQPTYWKAFNLLGQLELSQKNLTGAIEAFNQVVTENPNELLFTNIGTLNFCLNKVDVAILNYNKALKLAPQSHYGFEMLGMVHYFSGEYEESLSYRSKALKMVGGDGMHQMWGALGDSYLHLGKKIKSYESYQKALEILKRDELRGNLTFSDKAHELYYMTRMAPPHSSKSLPKTVQRKILNLNASYESLESSALLKLALTNMLLEKYDKSKQQYQTAIQRCEVYKRHPDLKNLLANN
ncbi:tetratricopeptide repeat protein [Aliiglaciecola aliphaticivorans]